MDQTSPAHLLARQRHRGLNAVHTWLLAGGSIALLAVTAYVFAGAAGVVAALAVGSVSMAVVGRVSPRMVLAMYKAEPVPRYRFAEAHRILDTLSRRAGLPAVPKLHVVPSATVNAFAVGRREESAIALTDGLVRLLTPRELAGVLAHEVSHIANADLRVMALADMVSRYTALMSSVGLLALLANLLFAAGGIAVQVPWYAVLVLVASPTVGSLLQLALSRTREFDADLGAVILTGDPDGLASALVKLDRVQARYWEAMVLPGGRMPGPSILRTHPPTDQRIERLMAVRDGSARPLHVASPGVVHGAPSVPLVPRRFGPRHDRDIVRIASFLTASPALAEDHAETSDACLPGGHCRSAGAPRLRLGRGGVWW
jgi:heat shock protein HtpX